MAIHTPCTILLVEDDRMQRNLLREVMNCAYTSATFIEAENGAEAVQHLRGNKQIDLALLDLCMPVMEGMAVLRQAKQERWRVPFIVLTGSEEIQDAVEAMRLGAVDFINKPVEPQRLLTSIHNALTLHNLRKEVNTLKQSRASYYTFDDILAVSPSLQEAVNLGRKAASSDIPVLITGESGVGKEVFAHAIHRASARASAPFISVNCGALPENLVESALFGHEKGAFTGATTKALGKCREADGGVLFLDEVGELKPDAQVKLLRLLQQGEIEPVGAAAPVKVDVRVISATNRPLEQMVQQGRFREDLYYRLHGLPLHIAPLRERRNDITTLAMQLLARITQAEAKPGVGLTEEALAWLTRYEWPGNIRELQHILARAVLLTDDNRIDAAQVARWARTEHANLKRSPDSQYATLTLQYPDGHFKSLEDIQSEAIEMVLAHYSEHVGKAAAALSIGQSTLYKRKRTQKTGGA